MTAPPILDVSNLTKHFKIPHGMFGRKNHVVQAVDQVSFTLEHGQTLALVGELGVRQDHLGTNVAAASEANIRSREDR